MVPPTPTIYLKILENIVKIFFLNQGPATVDTYLIGRAYQLLSNNHSFIIMINK